jgi:hypothetical protein
MSALHSRQEYFHSGEQWELPGARALLMKSQITPEDREGDEETEDKEEGGKREEGDENEGG